MEGNKKKRRNWLWVLILLLIVGGFILLFIRGCEGDGREVEDGGTTIEEGQTVGVDFQSEDTLVVDSIGYVDSVIEADSVIQEGVSDEEDEEEKETLKDGQLEKQRLEEQERKEQLQREADEKQKRQEQLQREAEERRRQQEEEEVRLAEEARLAEEERMRQQKDSLEEVKRRQEEERIMSEGILSGEFSVSWNTKVRFSQGNLQYQASTDTWRFAANQWDHEGMRNERIDPDYNGWIDLFGWGTSGYNKKYPFMISTEYYDYGAGPRTISNSQYDWGVYNAISNGGNRANIWRIMTNNEWRYLFCKRENAAKLFAFATVAGVKGIIVMPDNWKKPSSVKLLLSINHGLRYDADNRYVSTDLKADNYALNIVSISGWRILEEAGAVFLPAAGGRDYANVFEVQNCGFYWSGTVNGEAEAYMMAFSSGDIVATDFESRVCGFSVRLVRDVKAE